MRIEILLYQENLWLTQAKMAELFEVYLHERNPRLRPLLPEAWAFRPDQAHPMASLFFSSACINYAADERRLPACKSNFKTSPHKTKTASHKPPFPPLPSAAPPANSQ
ncbi:hypothetical protein C7256_25965 [Enterocloster lavalensis]|nr:hypothetical protein C7256_25965 [Enterocloster lavalensis]